MCIRDRASPAASPPSPRLSPPPTGSPAMVPWASPPSTSGSVRWPDWRCVARPGDRGEPWRRTGVVAAHSEVRPGRPGDRASGGQMALTGAAQRLTILIGESDQWHHRPVSYTHLTLPTILRVLIAVV